METLRLILGSKAFATIAGGSLLMVLGAALGVAIGSDSSSNAATSRLTITKNGTTRIVAVSAKPETKTVKHTVIKRKTVHKPGSTSVQTVTGPSQTVTHTVTQTHTVKVPTTVTQTITVTTGPPPPP
jgi:ABC-type glycerol-3-phosphate transport system substrate-binding protein